MTIKNIINIEYNRKDDEFYLIHLFKEGNWWSVYELSSIICHLYKNNLKDKLKLNKKHIKLINDDIIKSGLRATSFDKYLPNNENFFKQIDDKHIIIDAKEFIEIDINQLNYKSLIDNYKSKITNITEEKIITITK